MPCTTQEIIDHAAELAKRFEDYEPKTEDRRDPTALAELRAAVLARAEAEKMIAERAQQGAFPPDDPDSHERLWRGTRTRILSRINPPRRTRSNPRVIKRKMPRWHIKRSHHTHRPGPTRPPTYTIHAIN